MLIHDALWTGGLIVYSIIYGQLGVTELAIISFLSPIEGVLISTFMGFAVAASVLLGNDIGAQQYDRVENRLVVCINERSVGNHFVLCRMGLFAFDFEFVRDEPAHRQANGVKCMFGTRIRHDTARV